mgnify:CR=1 FL=1
MSNIQFRRCLATDAEQAVPLIYSSGPKAFDIAFSDLFEKQSLAFLHRIFVTPGSEFSFDQHVALIKDGQLVAVGGVKYAKQNLKFILHATKHIFQFYPMQSAFRTAFRGLKIESVLRPPKGGIAMIHNLAVSSEVRSEGLGRLLIAELEQMMLDKGYTTSALDVDGDNPRAKALYEQLGYKVKARHSANIKGRFTDALPMSSYYMEKAL